MTPNENQAEAWNGGESVHYVDHADRYDRQLAPFTDALFDAVELGPGFSVLDVGCGTGEAVLRAAPRVRRAVGLDISAPLVEVATRRAGAASLANVEFLVADAQTHALAEGEFDVVVSQFGLMFFDDPVAAFANLRRSLAPGGQLAFVTWQGLAANEWVMTLGRAVERQVPLPDLGGRAGGPGMFALKDGAEIVALLEEVGFAAVGVEAVSPTLLIGGGGTLEESVDFLLGMGIARGLLGMVGPEGRDEAVEAVRESLAERYEPGVGVRLDAAGWLVTAER